jgi:hypothetical protein
LHLGVDVTVAVFEFEAIAPPAHHHRRRHHAQIAPSPPVPPSQAYGIYDSSEGYAKRAIVVVSDKGVVRYTSVNDSGIGRSVEEVI